MKKTAIIDRCRLYLTTEVTIMAQAFRLKSMQFAKTCILIIALLFSATGLIVTEADAGSRHADTQIEALLPATLGGVTLTIESQAGTDLTVQSQPFDSFLKSLSKTRADFTVASAYAQGGLKAAVGAWRVNGVDSALLLPGFQTAIQASSKTQLTMAEEMLGGRAVNRIGDPGQLTQGPLYVYVRGDTLFFVQTPDHSLAQEAIVKLPD